jgi:transposase
VTSLLELIDAYDREVDRLNAVVTTRLGDHRGYKAIQAIPGVGPILGAVFVAEIGDVRRFPRPQRLCSWAGVTPRHRESDTVVRRGSITKQGSRLVRWAAVEAVQRQPFASKLRADRDRIAIRRDSKAIANVAAARKLLMLVYYGLRDGDIRCLARLAG